MTNPDPKKPTLWDCVDPCAFICYAIQIKALPFDKVVQDTLDAMGWLTEDGQPDYEKSHREFKRFLEWQNRAT